MKLIYLATALLFTTFSAASQSFLSKPMDLHNITNENSLLFPKMGLPMFQNNFKYKGGTIYALPQDNMPCLVPDVSSIAPIPTLRSGSEGQKIPNPYFGLGLYPLTNYNENLLPEGK